MKPHPLSVCLISFFLAHGILHSEALPPQQSDNFGLQLDAGIQVSEPDLSGTIRIHFGEHFLFGGGADAGNDWEKIGNAIPLDRGVLYEWTGDGWARRDLALPEPLAWAATVAQEDGILVAGGLRAEGISSRVSRWRLMEGRWQSEELPPLPAPMMLCGAQVMDDTLYLAGGMGPGGANADLLKLDLSQPERGWERMPMMVAGSNWMEPLLEVRKDEKAIRNCLVLAGGWRREITAPNGWRPVTTGLGYMEGRHVSCSPSRCISGRGSEVFRA